MAKIKINSLPKGFELKGGKIVKKLQRGGLTTGDQFDFGLVTSQEGYSNNSNGNNSDAVRYSLSSVPREIANLEAEGGETVLTDLSDDGKFGLYNITGPRHSSGGVPMYLPEQSFIFSDTQKMKFNRQELAEFGVESRKKMTPADVSKKFQLNEFIGAMSDPYIDDIKLKSAELMREKNQMSLSKLAFGQESKKQFSDGVPVTAHPYLMSQGIDPIEFTQKVESITREQAAQRMFEGMSPEQQAQMLAMQDLMSRSGQGVTAKYGAEMLPRAQFGIPDPFGTSSNVDFESLINDITPAVLKPEEYARLVQQAKDAYNANGTEGLNQALSNIKGSFGSPTTEENNPAATVTPPVEDPAATPPAATPPKKRKKSSAKRKSTIDQSYFELLDGKGIHVDFAGLGTTSMPGRQRLDKETGLYDEASANMETWQAKWGPIYGEDKIQEIVDSLKDYPAGARNPKVAAFQQYVNDTYIPEFVANIEKERIEKGYKAMSEDQLLSMKDDFTKNMGFPGTDGSANGVDGKLGDWTSSRLPGTFEIDPYEKKEEEKKKVEELDDPEEIQDFRKPEMDFYTQDLYKGAAIGLRKRDYFEPFRKKLERSRVDYVLNDPTREIADVNEKYNIAANVLGSFGGRQGLDASLSKQSGMGMKNAANVFAANKKFNIGTINQGKALNAQLDARYNLEDAKRTDFEYDGTVVAQQQRLNEKNKDMNDFMNWQADALTNANRAYNLSSLYDQFDIDPVAGGAIDFTNGRKVKGSKKQNPEALRQQRLSNIQDLYNQFGESGLKGDLLKYMDSGVATESTVVPGGNRANQMGITPEMIAAINAANGATGKNGKEIKPYATPFYTGTTLM